MKKETFDKHSKTNNNGKVKYDTKDKGKVDYGNYETKKDQYKEVKREDVKMNIEDRS